ncbi:MAG TPA: hypothetical protein VJL37_02645 [Flavobacterium sp.]|nr:hypothetical protein [Flavobacterium sp.]
MKREHVFSAVLLFFLSLTLQSCESVIGFFEEGMGYGTLALAAVMIMVIILLRPLRKNKMRKNKKRL